MKSEKDSSITYADKNDLQLSFYRFGYYRLHPRSIILLFESWFEVFVNKRLSRSNSYGFGGQLLVSYCRVNGFFSDTKLILHKTPKGKLSFGFGPVLSV